FGLIRRGSWRAHGANQTVIVLVNLILIAFVMVTSFVTQVLPERGTPTDGRFLLPTAHGLLGLVAELLGLYLVLDMFVLPAPLRLNRIKGLMRATLALWLFTLVVGVGVYLVLYAGTPTATVTAAGPQLGVEIPTAGRVGSGIVRDN